MADTHPQAVVQLQGEMLVGSELIGMTAVLADGSKCQFALSPEGAANLIALLGNLAAEAARRSPDADASRWRVVSG